MTGLFYRTKGEGKPLVMLHGLFGSGDNLGGLTRVLSEDYQTISVDLRGHGRSPHLGAISYPIMADDVIRVMDDLGVEKAHVLGHSMGGKTAMQLALSHSARIEKLVVEDISPVAYSRHHDSILQGMQAVAEASPDGRKNAEAILVRYESDPSVLSFLLTNWRREEGGAWGWRVDLNEISKGYGNIAAALEGAPFTGNTLFLRGGLSDYILPDHKDAILGLFPKATVRTINGTGHWLHAEKPDMVARAILKFLQF